MKISLGHVLFVCWIFASIAEGQRINRDQIDESRLTNLSEKPATRLLDLGEIFVGQEAEREKLIQRLDGLASRHQFSVYFVAYSGIIGSDVAEKAELLRDSWLGSREEGLILVCDTDMKSMAYALTKVDELPATRSGRPWKLPDHEAIAVMQKMSKISSHELSEKQYLNLMGNSLVDELEKKLEAKKRIPEKRSAGLLLAFALTAGLISAGLWWAQKKSAYEPLAQGSRFPVIPVSSRLGAPFGGGHVSEITFQPPRPPDTP